MVFFYIRLQRCILHQYKTLVIAYWILKNIHRIHHMQYPSVIEIYKLDHEIMITVKSLI